MEKVCIMIGRVLSVVICCCLSLVEAIAQNIPVAPPGTSSVTFNVFGPITVTANFAPLTNSLPTNYTLTQVTPNGTAAGINSFGQVAGTGYSNNQRPFLWTPVTVNGVVGSLTDLGGLSTAGFAYSTGTGINDRGQVVGITLITTPSQPQAQVFLWSPNSANSSTG